MKFEILDQNGGVARVEELDVSGSIKIGKTASCELCLDDPSVSRTHAVIEKTDAGYRLSDRMTPGGTYVNQQKVDPNSPVILANGSVLKFGQISVRVLFDSAAPAASIEEDDDTASAESNRSRYVCCLIRLHLLHPSKKTMIQLQPNQTDLGTCAV